MKVRAFTLMETIVSVLLVSLLGSMITLLIVRIYDSIPSPLQIQSEERAGAVVDSLIQTGEYRFSIKQFESFKITSEVQDHEVFDSVSVVTMEVIFNDESERMSIKRLVKKSR